MNPQIVGVNTIGQLQSTFRNNNAWQSFLDIERSQTGEFGNFVDVDIAISKMGTDIHLCVVTHVGKLYYVSGRITNNTITTWSTPYEIILNSYNPRVDKILRVACDLVGNTLHIFGLTDSGQIFSAIRRSNGSWTQTEPYMITLSGTRIKAIDIGCFATSSTQLDIPLVLSDGTFVSIFADTNPLVSRMSNAHYNQIPFLHSSDNYNLILPNGNGQDTNLKRVSGVVANNISTYFFTTEIGELLAFRWLQSSPPQNCFTDIRPLNNLPHRLFTDVSCAFKNNILHLVGIDDKGNILYTQLDSNTFSGNFIDIEHLAGDRGMFLAAAIG